jgi:hypothetical protein
MGVSAGSCKGTGTGVVWRLPLVAEPEPLAVVQEQLQRRRLAIAEDEDRTAERVVSEGLLAEPCQPVNAPAKVGRLDGHQDLHLGRDLEHHRASQKLRDSASMSAAS